LVIVLIEVKNIFGRSKNNNKNICQTMPNFSFKFQSQQKKRKEIPKITFYPMYFHHKAWNFLKNTCYGHNQIVIIKHINYTIS